MRAAAALVLAGVLLLALGGSPAPAATPRLVFAHYYPWYPAHWGSGNPIQSWYYPSLGRYNSTAAVTLAQHTTWLKQAKVDVALLSWWGQASPEDAAVPAVLNALAAAGLKAGFILEPYPNRTAPQAMADVRYLYDRYGAHPAFFRWSRPTWASGTTAPRGLFLLYDPIVTDTGWQTGVDALRGTPYDPILVVRQDDGLLVDYNGLVNTLAWTHADGVANYGAYDYSRVPLPLTDASFVTLPAIFPGFDNRRNGQGGTTVVGRERGAYYDRNWQAVLTSGRFETVAVPFNEWNESSQIEPAQPRLGYQDYRPLAPDYYLTRTAYWVDRWRAGG